MKPFIWVSWHVFVHQRPKGLIIQQCPKNSCVSPERKHVDKTQTLLKDLLLCEMAMYNINWVSTGHFNPHRGFSWIATWVWKIHIFNVKYQNLHFWEAPCTKYIVGMQYFIPVGTCASKCLPEYEIWALYLYNFLLYGPKCITEIPYFVCWKSPDMHFWGLTAPFMDVSQCCWIA